jgi:hypothetical protein
VRNVIAGFRNLFNRERTRIAAELRQIRELMPLLMKQRNGQPWTSETAPTFARTSGNSSS